MNSEQEQYIIVSVVLLAITYFSLGIRIFTRAWILKGFGLDDALTVAAVFTGSLCTIAPLVAIKYGYGDDFIKQRPEERKPYQQWILVSQITYGLTMTFVKLSFLAFYIRLSQAKPWLYTNYAVAAFVTGIGVAATVVVLVQCRPLAMLWTPGLKGVCIDNVRFYYANAGLRLGTDLMIFLMPMEIMWKLQLPLHQRLGLCSLFGLGGFIIIASIVRVIKIRQLFESRNPTVDLVAPLEWSIIEIHVSIFINCAPSFKAMLKRYLPSLLGTLSRGYKSQPDGYAAKKPYGQGSTSQKRKTIGSSYSGYPLSNINRDKAKKWQTNSVTISGLSKEAGESQERIVPPDQIWQDVTVTVQSERPPTAVREVVNKDAAEQLPRAWS